MSQLSDALVPKAGVPVKLLLLDPQNPRFEAPAAVDEAMFDTQGAQDATKAQLGQKQFGVQDLADSIRQIGFLRVDNVVVREFVSLGTTGMDTEQKYVVVEGNRRVAAVKSILDDKLRKPITLELEESIAKLDVLVLKPELCGMSLRDALDVVQGVRHISGVRGWGPYQQAMALRGVMSGNQLTQPQAAAAVSLSLLEANTDLNALGGYQQMAGDEEYGSRANPRLFSYFVEAVKKPAIRTWLEFSSDDREFRSDENRKLFYGWITPDDTDFQKIHDAQDVRKLVKVLPNAAALTALSNDDRVSIDVAVGMVSVPFAQTAIDWESVLESIVTQLDNFPATRLSDETDMGLLTRINAIVSGLLERQLSSD